MLNQEYTQENFYKLLKPSDPCKLKLGYTKEELISVLSDASEKVNKSGYSFSKFKENNYPHGIVYTTSSLVDEFVLRKLNDNLKRIFRVGTSNRSAIINQVKLLIKEPLPFTIVRLDIKRFYESIDKCSLLRKITSNPVVSIKSRKIIKSFFNSHSMKDIDGIPRGTALSNTLSEIYLQEFDRKVKGLDGVYYYVRYVDDVLIFCFKNGDIVDEVADYLPKGLAFNSQKTSVLNFHNNLNVDGVESAATCFNYLGYSFNVSCRKTVSLAYKTKKVSVGISEDKIKRMKKKMLISFFEFSKDNDFSLLKSRIRFLTSNYAVENSDMALRWKSEDDFLLKAGIYYNYHLVDNEQLLSITSLDKFLYALVASKSHSALKGVSAGLTTKQKNQLIKLSFLRGFQSKIMVSFSMARFKKINACWRYL